MKNLFAGLLDKYRAKAETPALKGSTVAHGVSAEYKRDMAELAKRKAAEETDLTAMYYQAALQRASQQAASGSGALAAYTHLQSQYVPSPAQVALYQSGATDASAYIVPPPPFAATPVPSPLPPGFVSTGYTGSISALPVGSGIQYRPEAGVVRLFHRDEPGGILTLRHEDLKDGFHFAFAGIAFVMDDSAPGHVRRWTPPALTPDQSLRKRLRGYVQELAA